MRLFSAFGAHWSVSMLGLELNNDCCAHIHINILINLFSLAEENVSRLVLCPARDQS